MPYTGSPLSPHAPTSFSLHTPRRPERCLPGEMWSWLLSDPGMKWQIRKKKKNLSFLQVLLLLIALILLCAGEKQNQTFDQTGEKYRTRKRKSVFCEGYTSEWCDRLESLGSWLSRAAANLLLGKGAEYSSTMRGWDHMSWKTLPSQLMLLFWEKETSANYRTPVEQAHWCTWAPHSSPTQICWSLTVIVSPSCWR